MTGGTAYYHFLEHLEKNYDSQKKAVAAKLKEVAAKLFTRSNMMISYTADDTGYEALPRTVTLLSQKLPEGSGERYPFVHPVENKTRV